MKRHLPFLLLLLLAPGGLTRGQPAQVIDRIAAVVDDQIVTLSDLDWLIRYRRLNVPEDEAGRTQLYRETLEQLIDQKLIASEALRTPGIKVTRAAVELQVSAYRNQFSSEEEFLRRLDEMEMTHRDLEELIKRQVAVLRFVKVRFEPFIIVVPEQIQDYYEEKLVRELEGTESTPPPLELVEEQIRQILTIEGTNREMDNWVQSQRRKARIELLLFREPSLSPNVPREFLGNIQLQPIDEKKPRY